MRRPHLDTSLTFNGFITWVEKLCRKLPSRSVRFCSCEKLKKEPLRGTEADFTSCKEAAPPRIQSKADSSFGPVSAGHPLISSLIPTASQGQERGDDGACGVRLSHNSRVLNPLQSVVRIQHLQIILGPGLIGRKGRRASTP